MSSTKSYKKPFFTIFLIVATELIGFGLIIPILPQLALQFNPTGLQLGILLSAYSFAQFFAAPLLGGLSDKWGRKPILVLSKAGTVVSYVILAFSGSYSLFLVSRLLDGFTGGNIAVARAYLNDITAPEDRAKGMAIIGISFGVGFIIGPGIGGLLYGSQYGHLIPALVAGSLSLLALFFTVFFLEESTRSESRVARASWNPWKAGWSLLRSRSIFLICLTQFVFILIFSGFETTFSVFTHHLLGYSERQNSFLFFYVGFLALIVQGFITRRPFKNLPLAVIIGLVLGGVSFIVLGASETLVSVLSSLVLLSLSIGLINTHLPAYLSNSVPDSHNGICMGLFESIGSLGRIVGPLCAYTTIFNHYSIGYMIYGVFLFLNIGLFGWGIRSQSRFQKTITP